ncbi:YgaP family membrane protein [Noviherbaspirillum agri]
MAQIRPEERVQAIGLEGKVIVMDIEKNVGGMDKAVRIVVGVVMVAVAMFAELTTGWRIVAWVVAAVSFLTAVSGFCPLNKLLGINTCRHRL